MMSTLEIKRKRKEEHRCYNCGRDLPKEETRTRCKICRDYHKKNYTEKIEERQAYSKGYNAGKNKIKKVIKEALKNE